MQNSSGQEIHWDKIPSFSVIHWISLKLWKISTFFRDSELNPKLGANDEKDGYIYNLESQSGCLKVNWNA